MSQAKCFIDGKQEQVSFEKRIKKLNMREMHRTDSVIALNATTNHYAYNDFYNVLNATKIHDLNATTSHNLYHDFNTTTTHDLYHSFNATTRHDLYNDLNAKKSHDLNDDETTTERVGLSNIVRSKRQTDKKICAGSRHFEGELAGHYQLL